MGSAEKQHDLYVIDGDDMRKLRELQAQLHGGNDRERDYGHRLWLILNRAYGMEHPDRDHGDH